MDVRGVESADQQYAVIELFRCLMKIECRLFSVTVINCMTVSSEEALACRKPLLKILLRYRRSLRRRLGLGHMELAVIGLVKRDAVLRDVHEEKAAMG